MIISEKTSHLNKQRTLTKKESHENNDQLLYRVEKCVEGEVKAHFRFEIKGAAPLCASADKKEKKSFKEIQKSFLESLVASLTPGRQLDFVFKNDKKTDDAPGALCWNIVGSTQNAIKSKVEQDAMKYLKDLGMIFNAQPMYRFVPVIPTLSKTDRALQALPWEAIIRPRAARLSGTPKSNVGFVSHDSQEKNTQILLPYVRTVGTPKLKALIRSLVRHTAPLTIRVSLQPVQLTSEEIKKLRLLHTDLEQGRLQQFENHPDSWEIVKDPELVKFLSWQLKSWLVQESGIRVHCHLFSAQPIPESFLGMVGDTIFPKRQWEAVQQKRSSRGKSLIAINHRDNQEGTSDSNIDFRDGFLGGDFIPHLLPTPELLEESGIPRFFPTYRQLPTRQGIKLGLFADTKMPIFLSEVDRKRHCYMMGGSGTGKSTLLYSMIRQDIEDNKGVCVFDPHGDLFNDLLEIIPKNRAEDVIILDPSIPDRAFGLNFLETTGSHPERERHFITNEMLKIFDRLYDLRTTGGPMFEYYMRNALLLVMDNKIEGGTLLDVVRLFEDTEYRKKLKGSCTNSSVVRFWSKQAEAAGGEISLENVAPYITSKLNQFTQNAIMRPIIAQSKSTIDFRSIMDENKILLVNLSKGLLGEMDAELLGMLVLGKLLKAALGRADKSEEERSPFHIYIDEFQNFTTDTMASFLSEARKYGVVLTLANQSLTQFDWHPAIKKISDAVLANTGNMFLFRLGVHDAERMAFHTRPYMSSHDLQYLPDFHVAARILDNHQPVHPFVFQTESKTSGGNSVPNPELAKKIATLSKLKYTKNIELVNFEIERRER